MHLTLKYPFGRSRWYFLLNHLIFRDQNGNLIALFLARSGLFEEGQEYQYSYLAYTNTGVREPEASGSSFGIKGTLIVQKNKDEAIVKVKFQRSHNFKWIVLTVLNNLGS